MFLNTLNDNITKPYTWSWPPPLPATFFLCLQTGKPKTLRTPWRLLARSALKLPKALTDSSGAYSPLETRGQVHNGSYWSISPSSCTSTSCISYAITQFFARLEEWRSLERPFSKWPFVGKQKFSSSNFTTRIPNWIYSTVLFVVIPNLYRTQREQ